MCTNVFLNHMRFRLAILLGVILAGITAYGQAPDAILSSQVSEEEFMNKVL